MSKVKNWMEKSAMRGAEQESRGDVIRARRKAEIDLIIISAVDVVQRAQYLENQGDLDGAIREVKRLFSNEFCRLQSRLKNLPFYEAAMKILTRPEVERKERVKEKEECFLMMLEEKWSSGTILEYLQLKYSSIGILMEFKNGSHGLAYHELLRNRSIFPKRCPGCVGLDPTLIHEVIKTLVGGQRGCPYSIDEIFPFQMLSKRYYQRRNDRYPFMGNCLDFGLFNSHTSSQANEKFLQDMNALGKLLCEGEGSSKS